MKKDPSDYTAGERKFADLVAALKAEHKNAREVEVTYEDFSKKTFSPAHYQRMHREVK